MQPLANTDADSKIKIDKNNIEINHTNNSIKISSEQNLDQKEFFTPVAEYAPEFVGTHLDLPDTIVANRYFQFFTRCTEVNSMIYDIQFTCCVIESGIPNRFDRRIPLVQPGIYSCSCLTMKTGKSLNGSDTGSASQEMTQ